jgi:hypothetical protein
MEDGASVEAARGQGANGFGAVHLAAELDRGYRGNVVLDYASIATRLLKAGKFWRELKEEIPPDPAPGPSAPEQSIGFSEWLMERPEDGVQQVVLRGETELGVAVQKWVSLGEEDQYFRVAVSLHTLEPISLEWFDDRLFICWEGEPDFTWLPHVKYVEDNICADWAWKSPAAIYQQGRRVLALIPDVSYYLNQQVLDHCSAALDMDIRRNPLPGVSCGLVPSYPHGHSLFRHIRGHRAVIGADRIGYAYFLLLSKQAAAKQGHRPIVHFLWKRFGRPALLGGHAAQKYPFSVWEKKTWHEYSDEVWQEFEYLGQACGSLQCPNFDLVGDAWFCGWWNNVRTAYGLELYSRRCADRVAHSRATRIINLAIAAPRQSGAFPVLFLWDQDSPRWIRDHSFAGYPDYYHCFDMSWTSYWLLRWCADLCPEEARIVPLCVAYGDFLLKIQQESGFIPSYVDEGLKSRPMTRLNEEGAEPAVSALFLVELYKTVRDDHYLLAARRAMDYIQQDVVPANKWFDYETFLSCSPKPYDFYDPITGQQPQNNMGTIQTAKAFLSLYEATGERRYLEWGKNVLDYLSLTQQVWSHPRFTPNLIGGFTSQNSDAEWSDARQAHCAILYLDYFEHTGEVEYLERGVAALRASFPVAPAENYAHIGYPDVRGAISGIHWGQGSAMASVEMIWEQYGDVLLDIGGGWGIGINGCTIERFAARDRTISFHLITDLEFGQPLRVVARNPEASSYFLNVNGKGVGEFSTAEMTKGILLAPAVIKPAL